jgi:hypothetical protein
VEAQSVYEVSNEIEEVYAIAAHILAATSPKLENCYLIRFRNEDILQSGVTLSDAHLGETGVVLVDHRHRDFLGKRTLFEVLMKQVISGLHQGQDRIRWLKKAQLEYALERFLELETCERPTHTAHWCEVLLNKRTETTICRDQAQTKNELAIARIPEEAIRQRAGKRWLTNGGPPTGSAVDDWLATEAEMRDAYRRHYLACHLG